MSITLKQSGINFLFDDTFGFSGIDYNVAAVCSPLVEEGSGQGLGHPMVKKAKAAKVTVSKAIPCTKDAEELIREISIPEMGSVLSKGDSVISFNRVTVESWQYAEGRIVDYSVKFNPRTNTLNVKVQCLVIERSDAEKYRLGKYRSNGGFLRNILVTEGRGIIFDPNTELYRNGKPIQAEHVVGAEEFKTLLFALGIVTNNGIDTEWDSKTGKWVNEEIITEALETQVKKVTVTRWGIEQKCYEMLKTMYGEDPNFKFDDSMNQIIHTNVWCYYGNVTQIVEVPMTATFVGKCAMFAEHIHYIGTEFPNLYEVLLNDVQKNQKAVLKAYDMVLGEIPESCPENPNGNLITIDGETEIHFTENKKVSVDLVKDDSGTTYMDKIYIPEDREYSLELMAKLNRSVRQAGYSGFLFIAEGNNKVVEVPVDFEILSLLVGSESQNLFTALITIFWCLEVCNDERGYDNWSGNFYRAVSLFYGSLEFLVGDSAALARKASKTSKVAFTCRAGSTIDASVKPNEIHIHSLLIQEWGIQPGDLFLIGRCPVPGLGILSVVSNNSVPYGTAVMNAAVKHAVEEGDCDGDSLVALCIDREGNLKRPAKNIVSVNPIAD